MSTDAPVAEPQTNQSSASQPANVPQPAIATNEAKTVACYANFARVTGTPEELILDFCLNAQPMSVPAEPIEISQRIIVNYFTAKRFLAALSMSVQRHEAAFGVLETDVQKRVTPGLRRTSDAAR